MSPVIQLYYSTVYLLCFVYSSRTIDREPLIENTVWMNIVFDDHRGMT